MITTVTKTNKTIYINKLSNFKIDNFNFIRFNNVNPGKIRHQGHKGKSIIII